MSTLTETQRQVLDYAADHGGRISWFPDKVKGGARKKVIDGLCNKALITEISPDDTITNDVWFISSGGYDALGRLPMAQSTTHPDPDIEAALVATEAVWVAEKQEVTAEQDALGDAQLDAKQDAKQESQPEAQLEAEHPKVTIEGKPRTRDNTKQATVIAMLKRSEGATITQICEATGWQSHTVRGAFAGALKKKLGLNITSDKPDAGERIYRI